MILDILNNPEAEFVANNLVTGVALALPLPNQLFLTSNGLGLFQAGDNVKIREINVLRAFQYGRADSSHTIGLRFSNLATIPELGNASSISLPDPCDRLQVNLFIQALTGLNFGFVLSSVGLTVSQIGGPSSLNGLTLRWRYQLVCEHTLPMV